MASLRGSCTTTTSGRTDWRPRTRLRDASRPMPQPLGALNRLLASAAADASSPSASSSSSVQQGGVLVVGGGPTGTAVALMLARRGWRDITVLEKVTR